MHQKSKSSVFFIGLILFFLSSCTKEEKIPETEFVDPKDQLVQVEVSTNGLEIPDEPKIQADIKFTNNDTTYFTHKIGIEVRGQSSQWFPKKQYGFELWDNINLGISNTILDFPSEEDFILSAPYTDKSLMRNVLIYELSRDIGRYAARTKFVDLKLNGSSKGTYVFMEKLKRDVNRIDISKLKNTDNSGEELTGGYIIKIDKDNDYFNNSFESKISPRNAASGQTIKFVYDTPKPNEITAQQKTYIQNYIHEFEAVLNSDNFKDPNNGYQKYINVDSFVDFFLLNEISNNVDGYRLSTWVIKDKNEKLAMGPIWDFNLAFGNADYCSGGETNVWAYKFNDRCNEDFWVIPFWWERLMEDPYFRNKIKTRWNELKTTHLSANNMISKVDKYKELLSNSGSASKNFGLWSVLGVYVWPNKFIGNTWDEEVNYLKDWINNRYTWLDTNINSL